MAYQLSELRAVQENLSGPPPRLETPRDRLVNFEPNIVAKRQVVLTDQLEGQIISMYGRGMSYSDIGKHIQEIYGYSLSPSEISSITDKILPMLREWQVRPLSNIYIVAWLDAMYYKVRVDGKVLTRVLYSVIGLNLQGRKSDRRSGDFRYLFD